MQWHMHSKRLRAVAPVHTPKQNHPVSTAFELSSLNGVASGILADRAGHASKEMLAIDKKPFLQIGACEAASQLLFMLVRTSHICTAGLPEAGLTHFDAQCSLHRI